MKKSSFLRCVFSLFFLLALKNASCTASNHEPPNIVIYMVDDMGVGCVGPYGASPDLVKTPHIDRLAANGLTFDNASSTASVCSPTRYAMLTGQYSWRSELQYGVVDTLDPLLIDPKTPTIASWLQEKGYQTAHVGKWHLGYKSKSFKNLLGEISPGPNDVGFDYHFGVPNNMDDLHKVYIENRGIFGLRSDRMSPYGKSFYEQPWFGYDAPQRNEPEAMEELNKRALNWLKNRNPDKPFFLYYGAVAVHHPIMPSARNFGSSPAGTYGDFIHDVDFSVGQIVESLEKEKLLKNTIFIFTADNGSDIPGKDSPGWKKRPENQAIKAGLAPNGKWRGDKHAIYEGGFRVPLIVSYPAKVKGGERSDAFVTTADFYATIMEILGEKPAKNVAPDSFSFAKTLLSDPTAPSDRTHGVFRSVTGQKAVRFSQWKLIDPRNPRDKKKESLELYNLKDDPSEMKDVSDQYPEIVEQGTKLLNSILEAKSSRGL